MNHTPSINDMMQAYAHDAADHALANFGVNLDYSPDSIAEVEKILGHLHESIPRGWMRLIRRKPSVATIELLCKMYGGYIGEVFRRKFGGHWELREDVPGVEAAVVAVSCLGGETFFPPAKVWKRLHDGAEDDVWSYFRVLASRADNNAA